MTVTDNRLPEQPTAPGGSRHRKWILIALAALLALGLVIVAGVVLIDRAADQRVAAELALQQEARDRAAAEQAAAEQQAAEQAAAEAAAAEAAIAAAGQKYVEVVASPNRDSCTYGERTYRESEFRQLKADAKTQRDNTFASMTAIQTYDWPDVVAADMQIIGDEYAAWVDYYQQVMSSSSASEAFDLAMPTSDAGVGPRVRGALGIAPWEGCEAILASTA